MSGAGHGFCFLFDGCPFFIRQDACMGLLERLVSFAVRGIGGKVFFFTGYFHDVFLRLKVVDILAAELVVPGLGSLVSGTDKVADLSLNVAIKVKARLRGMSERLLSDGMAPRIFPVDKRMFYHKQWVAMRGKLLLIGHQVGERLRVSRGYLLMSFLMSLRYCSLVFRPHSFMTMSYIRYFLCIVKGKGLWKSS